VSGGPRVTLIGKPDCHLCDAARAVIDEVCAETGDSYVERSILDDPELADLYWEQIGHARRRRQHDFWRGTPAACAPPSPHPARFLTPSPMSGRSRGGLAR
jgi:hypothetical protein